MKGYTIEIFSGYHPNDSVVGKTDVLYVSDTHRNTTYIWDGQQFCTYITKEEQKEMQKESHAWRNVSGERYLDRTSPIERTTRTQREFSLLWGLIKIKF